MLEAYQRSSATPIRSGILAAPQAESSDRSIDAFAAGHPLPDAQSLAAGMAARRLVSRLSPDDRLVVLLSGGASALLASPSPPVTVEDKILVTRLLLSRGIGIDGLNAVRKHLSLIKGGQLAAACAAPVETFALSDVTVPFDDDPATIGSGPTVADPTTFEDARQVLARAEARWTSTFPRVATRLQEGLAGRVADTPKPGDRRLHSSKYTLIGNRHSAAQASAEAARAAGLTVVVRDAAISGEARDAGTALVDEALDAARDAPRPFCYIATGETTVTVLGAGRGGRNQELALSAAIHMSRHGLVATLASVGTDGIDGPTSAAGAVADETTLSHAVTLGWNAERALAANDSHTFFTAIGDALVTGPTETNVGDLMVVLVT
jgi:glycerate-2-kinase